MTKKDLQYLLNDQGRNKIMEVISSEEYNDEKRKTDLILVEIEKMLTKKKLLAN